MDFVLKAKLTAHFAVGLDRKLLLVVIGGACASNDDHAMVAVERDFEVVDASLVELELLNGLTADPVKRNALLLLLEWDGLLLLLLLSGSAVDFERSQSLRERRS